MEFSPDLLYSPVPNSSGVGWSHDSNGFRTSNGNLKEKPNNSLSKITIAITGGSTAWGVGVKDNQTIASVMNNILTKSCSGYKFNILNAAISAQTSGQERRRFETQLLPMDIDIYIAVTGFNDIYNAYTGLLPHQNRDYFDVSKLFRVASVNDTVPQPPLYSDYNIKLLYLLAKMQYNLTVDENDVIVAVRKRALEHNVTIDAIMRNLTLLDGWSKHYGFEFLYALQPTIYNTKKTLTKDELIIRDSDPQFGSYNSEGYKLLRKELSRQQIEHSFKYFDLDIAIQNTKKDLFIDSVHFGDRGYKVLAENLVKHLLENSLILKSKCNFHRI